MTVELPMGWQLAPVDELFSSFGGGTPDKGTPSYWGGNIPWLSSGDIKTDRIKKASDSITQSGLDNSSAKLCRPGSVVVVVRSGILRHTLPVAVLDIEAAINQDIKCFDSGSNELNAWLAFVLRASAARILALNREGTTVQSVKYETLKEFELPVPPVSEQQRIMESLDTLTGQLRSSKNGLTRIGPLLLNFRRAVLSAACSGRLTTAWRAMNSSDQRIDAILQSVRRMREIGAHARAAKQRIQEIFAAAETQDSSELPANWKFLALNKLCFSFDYGSSAKSQAVGNIPVLRMGNIQNGEVNWDHLAFTSRPQEIEKYSLLPNTVLFNRTNSPELVGKAAIYRGGRPATFAGYLIRINPVPELDPEYLNYCLNTSYAKEFCWRVKTDGVSQSNINATKLGTFEVPFCSLQEQREVVRRVRAIFKLSSEIEARHSKACTSIDKLRESLFDKALRGKLVPSEAELGV